MTNCLINQGGNLIVNGLKNAPTWAKVTGGIGLIAGGVYGIIKVGKVIKNFTALKDQETAERKSALHKEEALYKSQLKAKESEDKTNQAIELDDRKTDNKIRIIQAKGQEERAKIALKHDLSQKVSSTVEDIVVEPTFPTTTNELNISEDEFLDGPLFYKGGVNILAGAPGAGKSCMLSNFLYYMSGTLQRSLFSNEKPDKHATCYLYDYELGKGFNKRYHGLDFRNFHRCDVQEKADKLGDAVYTLDYLYRQIQEDLEYPSGDVIMAIDCKGKISDANDRANELINRLKRFISDYESKKKGTLTFILVEHLNPNSASPSTILCESKIKGSQAFNAFADQTILLGKTSVDGCVRVKIAKNRYGKEQVCTIHLFQRVDEIYFNYIGEYDESQVLVPKHGSCVSLDEFRKKVKPTLTPTYTMLKTNSKPGRPTNLTQPICMAILNARSQGQSRNAASKCYGFTRQAYNEALVRYGLVDNYPDGNWKS